MSRNLGTENFYSVPFEGNTFFAPLVIVLVDFPLICVRFDHWMHEQKFIGLQSPQNGDFAVK